VGAPLLTILALATLAGAQEPASDAEADPVQQQLLELQAQVDALQAKISAPEDLSFTVEGYYRTRGYLYHGLFASQYADDSSYNGDAHVMTQRLKLRPVFAYKDAAKLMIELDLFGDPQTGSADVVWGDNASRASTALFAGDPSNAGMDGLEGSGPRVTRAWTEFKVPVGLLRVGRQPSNWGMGLLANSGDGFDDPFGENHYGATYDRAMFATKPISVVNGILDRPDKDIPLIAAFGVDRLVEDPLIQYYGYKCDSSVTTDDPRCAPPESHSYTDETYTDARRRPDWFANNGDDVMETVYVLMYKGEDVQYLGEPGDLSVGTYVVNRTQTETDSNVVIADAYLRAKNHGVFVEFEGLTIQGRTSAIALPGAYDPSGSAADPLYKQANIWGYVGRLGVDVPKLKAVVEHGYASGDDNPTDAAFTGRALAPDHNVGLILYDEVIARVTANAWTEGGRGLWSNGGVYNSRYVFPWADLKPKENVDIVLGGVVAWPDKPDGAIIQCRAGDYPDGRCADVATAGPLGWELDAALKLSWDEHMRFAVETAYAHATDRLPLVNAGLNPSGNFFTVQTRVAWEF